MKSRSNPSSEVLSTSCFTLGRSSYKVDFRESKDTRSKFAKISVKIPRSANREEEMKYFYIPEAAIPKIITSLQRIYYRHKSREEKKNESQPGSFNTPH